MKTNILFLSAILLIFFSCDRQQKQTRPKAFGPIVVEAEGYVVPKDSMAEPRVIPVDESNLKKIPVGKPKVVLTNTNIHPAGKLLCQVQQPLVF